MNYFRRFIPRFPELAAPLYEQTKDDVPAWDSTCTAAFKMLKQVLCNCTELQHPDPSKDYHVYVDASLNGVGGVLMQDFGTGFAACSFLRSQVE